MVESEELLHRVLSELEEAGEEELCTLLNTVIDASGSSDEIDIFKKAMADLVSSGLVEIELDNGRAGNKQVLQLAASLERIADLSMSLKFYPEERIWNWCSDLPRLNLFVTETGWARAREILDERGYQWWRQ